MAEHSKQLFYFLMFVVRGGGDWEQAPDSVLIDN